MINEDDTVGDFKAHRPITAIDVESISEAGVEIAALTHPGMVRENNEDHYMVVRKTRSATVLASSLSDDQLPETEDITTWLLVVADGLGGHASGEIASATAVGAILNMSNEMSSWIMRPGPVGTQKALQEQVRMYADAIQAALSRMAKQNPALTGMATTINAVYVFDDHALMVNVGDSRAYLFRNQSILHVTKDHTLAEYMQSEGVSQAKSARFRNLVTRTFNTDGQAVDFDLYHLHLEPGDQILLCSDGLTDMIDDAGILSAVNEADSPGEACESLVRAALEAGGRDNVTTILLHK